VKQGFRKFAGVAAMCIIVATAGCNRKATGQVAAVVNGEEITIDELNAGLNGAKIPDGADKKMVMKQVLQQEVDRRLLAQAAKEQGLDRDPTYVMQQRRMNEDLLVRMFAKKSADSIPVPSAGEIDKYIADNPNMFAGRTRYKMDQIQFDRPADISQLKALEGDHSMAAVTAKLTQLGIKFERGSGALDSGSVPPNLLKQITSLPPGEPFVTPNGNKVVVGAITGQEALHVPDEQVRPLAVQSIRNEKLSKIGEDRLKQARNAAKVQYQPGYEPAPAKPAATP
jgi:EpsD family peptidyl-prolyl cis-trans isomerase